jgi:hypothetical protein
MFRYRQSIFPRAENVNALIPEPFQAAGERLPGSWVAQLRVELEQGLKDEAAAGHARMGHLQVLFIDDPVRVKEKIDVDRARTFRYPATAVTPETRLDGQSLFEQGPWLEIRPPAHHDVEKEGLVYDLKRCRLV